MEVWLYFLFCSNLLIIDGFLFRLIIKMSKNNMNNNFLDCIWNGFLFLNKTEKSHESLTSLEEGGLIILVFREIINFITLNVYQRYQFLIWFDVDPNHDKFLPVLGIWFQHRRLSLLNRQLLPLEQTFGWCMSWLTYVLNEKFLSKWLSYPGLPRSAPSLDLMSFSLRLGSFFTATFSSKKDNNI